MKVYNDILFYEMEWTEGKYYISKNGDVYNSLSNIILKPHIERGYKRYRFLSKNYYMHRLLAIQFMPRSNMRTEVNHKDGDKLNNNLDNLEWVTHSHNIKHAYDNNLIPDRKGCNHPRSRITDKQLSIIRFLLDDGRLMVKDIAVFFGLGYGVVSGIKNGRSYKQNIACMDITS